MSILAAAAAAGEPGVLLQLLVALALIGAGLFAAQRLGAFAPRSVRGPTRLGSGTSVVGIFGVLVVGFIVWFVTQIAYFGLIRHRIPVDDDGRISVAMLPPSDMAVLGTVPFIVGLTALMLGDLLAKPSLPRELGWSPRHLPRGIVQGAVAMLSVLPLMFGAGIGLELFYRAIGYEHPTEHEMLTVLGRSRDQVTKYLIVGGATLLAPVFEEFLFRGHLQTLIVGVFMPGSRGLRLAGVVPSVPDPLTDPPHSPPPVAPPDNVSNGPLAAANVTPLAEFGPPVPSSVVRWTAIIITSLAFAVMHPAWTWPLIFLLSLALGYAYERTGNLWVPVVMHLAFNSSQTAIFLLSRSL